MDLGNLDPLAPAKANRVLARSSMIGAQTKQGQALAEHATAF